MNIDNLLRCSSGFDAAVDSASTRGQDMMDLMARLWPICRAPTGAGIRETYDILSETIPLKRHRMASGTKVFDWTVPKEWNIRDAYIKDPQGKRIVDFRENNLHVVHYSTPISAKMSLSELKLHLHSLPGLPEAIPYMCSAYEETWGFCLTHQQLQNLVDGEYEVVIDSSLEDGYLDYCDLRIGPEDAPEILISTYCDHPSMANNELSGPIITLFLYEYLAGIEDLRFAYRFLFLPETIGAIVYLHQHGSILRERVHAGFEVTCCGDDGPYNYKRSRQHNSASDQAATHVLSHGLMPDKKVIIHDYFPQGGANERQYNSPGFNLPIGSLTRSMYGSYPEYHTSLDNMDFVSSEGMSSSLVAYLRIFQTLECDRKLLNTKPYGEPQLGKRGLYVPMGIHDTFEENIRDLLFLLCYCDGNFSLFEIAEKIQVPIWRLMSAVKRLAEKELLTAI